MEFNLDNLVRENIKKMTAYSSARHEYSGTANIYLDANENSFGSPLAENYNRYPDPLQLKLKEKMPSTSRNLKTKVDKVLRIYNTRCRNQMVCKILPNGHIVVLPKVDKKSWIKIYK